MATIAERLQDPNERFTPAEMMQAFESLCQTYGFYRSKELPDRSIVAETGSLTVPKFEHLGVLVIRPRSNRDQMLTIPNLVDKLLGDNFQPSQSAAFNANLIALAKTVIVAPVGIVETILSSSDVDDLNFFLAFAEEFKKWSDARLEDIRKKKSGIQAGIESAS